jgi:hypothetical protein
MTKKQMIGFLDDAIDAVETVQESYKNLKFPKPNTYIEPGHAATVHYSGVTLFEATIKNLRCINARIKSTITVDELK